MRYITVEIDDGIDEGDYVALANAICSVTSLVPVSSVFVYPDEDANIKDLNEFWTSSPVWDDQKKFAVAPTQPVEQ